MIDIPRGAESIGFDSLAHALEDWVEANEDHTDADEISGATSDAEAFCTCHGDWPRSGTSSDALETLKANGVFAVTLNSGFDRFEIRYSS